MTDVHLDGVTKEYAGSTALSELSLHVEDGEFFTLVGPSGCGKTTTLRLLAGFESPTEGRVRFGDDDVAGVPPEDRRVGVVFQNYALFPHMSVAENVAYGLRFSEPPDGQSKAARVADLLDLVDLSGMGEREPDALSGGQQQRVAIARALAPGPHLLLLDEPMSALDARLRERLRVQVKELQSDLGVTTVYVTHDQEEALAVSDRVAVLHDGRLEQVGTPRDVYRRPATRFVAEFVGDNNVFEGEVVDSAVADTGTATPTTAHDTSVSPLETKEVTVRVNGTRFALAAEPAADEAESADARSVSAGDTLTFCVRPEHLRLGTARERGDDSWNRFEATVASAEFLGERTRVHLDWDGTPVTVRLDAFEGEPGDRVTVGFDADATRLLD
ncbi:ABC transporter ATP-binding protein [Halobium salinum]|uniref:Molybdate/tungstate import ATP-binding protein WtpC n=1 Tax=Halobium salinum TaxID=1364940 RepID=A0ABD5PG00_9EURY|nr:ABC transporter ATP-binding protein [Halobium salinum]